jgi:hypothetical protein
MSRSAAPLLVALCAFGPWTVTAQSIFRGIVRDSATGSPIAGAEVLIASIRMSVRTDARGRFLFDEISGGRYAVMVRMLGYDSTTFDVGFSGADTVFRSFDLAMRAQPLAEVPVRAAPEPWLAPGLREFERRRAMGIGRFLSAADLEKDVNRRTGDIISRMPGAIVLRVNMVACVVSSRGLVSLGRIAPAQCGSRGTGLCPVAVFLDGVPVQRGDGPLFDVNSIHVGEIAALEFYAGPAQMPPELNATRATCGALVIWTR